MWLTANGCDRHPAQHRRVQHGSRQGRRWPAVLLPVLLSVPAVTQAVEVRFSATFQAQACSMTPDTVQHNIGSFTPGELMNAAASGQFRPAYPEVKLSITCSDDAAVKNAIVTFTGDQQTDIAPVRDAGADINRMMVMVKHDNPGAGPDSGYLGLGLRMSGASGQSGVPAVIQPGTGTGVKTGADNSYVIMGEKYWLGSLIPATTPGQAQVTMTLGAVLGVTKSALSARNIPEGNFSSTVTVALTQQ